MADYPTLQAAFTVQVSTDSEALICHIMGLFCTNC